MGGPCEESSPEWQYDEQLRTYWFSDPLVDRPRAYRACGVLLGYAVLMENMLPAAFPVVLYSILLRNLGSTCVASAPTLADVALVRPSLAQGLKELIDYKGDDIADVFPLDWPRGHELSGNTDRDQYVYDYIQWYFSEHLSQQLMPLCEGFRAVVGKSPLLRTLVNGVQLEQIICGLENSVDIEAIRANAELVGWRQLADNDYIDNFWQVLNSFSDAEQRSFLIFVSSSAKMPPEGWQNFQLKVQKNGTSDNRLPTAQTCFNLLMLPKYSTFEILHAKLQTAICNTEGFGLR